MIDRFIQKLHAAKLELSEQELAEALWLAQFLPIPREAPSGVAPAPRPPAAPEVPEPAPTQRPEPSAPSAGTASVKAPTPATVALPPVQPRASVRAGDATLELLSPSAPALPHVIELTRALRPLRRRVPSRLLVSLDEVATAERIAEQGLWVPVLRPTRSRWLDVVLVVDRGRSMAIWRKTLSELERLLEGQGAFRDVRTWELDTHQAQGPLGLRPLGSRGAFQRSPQELIDTRGRRLILVVSDCVSPAWHAGRVDGLLRDWGRHGPVAIVQVLPRSLWNRTALRRAVPAELHGRAPGLPNEKLDFRVPGAFAGETRRQLPMPVVTLEKGALSRWARMLVGAPLVWTPGVLLGPERGEPRPAGAAPEAAASRLVVLTPTERVRRFRGTASPPAQLLARLLSATPLSLPVMRLVRQTMLPQAEQVHLAEVFLGGLIHEVPTEAPSQNPDETRYEFHPGVRELLLQSLTIDDSLEVLRRTSRFLERRLGQSLDFIALLSAPGALGAEEVQPFAHVSAHVLRRLGGEYAELADRLDGRAVEVPEPVVEPVPNEVIQVQNLAVDNLPPRMEDSRLHEVIRRLEHPENPGLFLLGAPNWRTSLHAEQVQALNLIHALFETGRLQVGSRVAVHGVGVAGLTAAAGAVLRGCEVIFLEEGEHLLSSLWQYGSQWLHPHVYDWPEAGADNPHAGLPVLDWRAGLVEDVLHQLQSGWEQVSNTKDSIPAATHLGSRVDALEQRSGWRVYWSNFAGSKRSHHALVDAFILDRYVGVTHELSADHPEEREWFQRFVRDDWKSEPQRVLISQTNEYSLERLLSLLLPDFRPDVLVEQLLSTPEMEEVRRRLLDIEGELRITPVEMREVILWARYTTLPVPSALDETLQRMAARRPVTVVLCGRGSHPLLATDCILHRFLLSRLLGFRIQYRQARVLSVRRLESGYSVGFEDASGPSSDHFDHVLVESIHNGLSPLWKRLVRETPWEPPSLSVRMPLWPEGAFHPPWSEVVSSEASSESPPAEAEEGSEDVSRHGRLVWSKILSATDAQRVKEGSHPVGGIRLTQAGFTLEGEPIDQTRYFRHQLFGHFDWSVRSTEPFAEMAVVPFDVTLFGTHLGLSFLEVSHKPSGEAQQGNYTTTLHLGPLREVFRKLDVQGARFDLHAPAGEGTSPFFIVISAEAAMA